MEESDLAWRLLDAGWSIWYSADLTAFHPHTTPVAPPRATSLLTARNRLWMAWRSLPAPVLAAYLLTWTLAAVVRGAPLREVLAGYRRGLVRPSGAAADALAHGRPDDPAGPTADGVTSAPDGMLYATGGHVADLTPVLHRPAGPAASASLAMGGTRHRVVFAVVATGIALVRFR